MKFKKKIQKNNEFSTYCRHMPKHDFSFSIDTQNFVTNLIKK